MRILIAGGLGYVGGRLARFLASDETHEVLIGSSRHITGTTHLNWSSQSALERCCENIDVIIHASGMNAEDSAKDPASALEINGVATARLLQAAIQKKVRAFIYFSTAHVYAAALTGTISEEMCTANLHPYATSHKAAEDILLAAHKTKNIQGVVLRLSNSIGAPVHKNVNCWMLLVNDLCREAVQYGTMTLRSNGMQERNFIPLNDVCIGVEKIITKDFSTYEQPLFNLGCTTSMSILAMAVKIQERCNVVLGFRPILKRLQDSGREKIQQLVFNVDRLAAIGCSFPGNYDNEIDELLLFCAAHFKNTGQ